MINPLQSIVSGVSAVNRDTGVKVTVGWSHRPERIFSPGEFFSVLIKVSMRIKATEDPGSSAIRTQFPL
jgi:hypothetical protein